MNFLEQRIGKLIEVLHEQSVRHRVPVTGMEMAGLPSDHRTTLPDPSTAWHALGDQHRWRGPHSYAWFRAELVIPECMAGHEVFLSLSTGRDGWDATNPQFLAYVDGQIRQGLDVNHQSLLLTDNAQGGERYDLMLSAYAGNAEGDIQLNAALEAVDLEVRGLYHDLLIPHQAARLMQREDGHYIRILQALNDAVNLLDLRELQGEAFDSSVREARQLLKERLYTEHQDPHKPEIYCVGHTHIDVAWLWPLSVTEDKAVRSFATVLELMQQYPEYRFMSSQPQLYKYVEKHAPALFERIREAVRDGRWEPEGAMFVEADSNLSGGEALIRQIVRGKQYFRRQFDRDNEIVWLPDVFGYSAALPQIFLKSGICYFMTTKISWNEVNQFPYDSFMWQGLDGSCVLTHFSPSRDYNLQPPARSHENQHFTTYNAILGPKQLMGAWQRYQQKDLSSIALMSFGYGDGGGGPTREMLEAYDRLRHGLPGVPRAVMSDSRQFFRALEQQVQDNPRLPTWVGEMYLEYHRGTYTSMACNKRSNRKGEFALMNCELYSSLAELLMQQHYPAQRIGQGWEILLRNQFHDILPGSSIKEVYEDSRHEYEELEHSTQDISRTALDAVVEGVRGDAGDLIVFNPNSFPYEGPLHFPMPEGWQGAVVQDGERRLNSQLAADGQGILIGAGIPPKGYKRLSLSRGSTEGATARIEGRQYETAHYRLRFDEQMHMEELYDKQAQRQVLKPGCLGNRLMSYEDRPHKYDAWDINSYYKEHSWPIDGLQGVRVLENGPVRCVIQIRRQYLSSSIEQRIILYADSRRIDVENDWEWKERHLLVKALFPVDVLADEASYEIQFGHVKRPTHLNTSWDAARFEVCHHKWLDLSEEGYGVSLLNDCKYGASVHFGEIGLTLLKSAAWPNPDADRERHRFTYSLLPHQGSWQEAGVLQAAYELNNPATAMVKTIQGGQLPDAFSLVHADQPNVVVETVKQSELDDALVLRAYEAHGRRSEVCLCLGAEIQSASECNLMEEEDKPIASDGRSIRFTIRPFEIRTFKLYLKEGSHV